MISPISLFADDSKIFTKITSERNNREANNTIENEVLQKDLNNVKDWAAKWKMEFNVDKCKIMHLGHSNPKHEYYMGGTTLEVTKEEKDLGVLVDDKLGFSKHIKGIVGKANRMLGLIRIGFACLNKMMFMNLYPVLIRPLLEYCVQVWSPYKQGDIDLLEGVQRRATRMVPELRELKYEERLRVLGLTTLEERRARGDLIETYKLITNKEDVDPNKFFRMVEERGDPDLARGHKIFVKSGGTLRRHVFSHRVVESWNDLERVEVEAETIATFKARFDTWEADRKKARENRIYAYLKSGSTGRYV